MPGTTYRNAALAAFLMMGAAPGAALAQAAPSHPLPGDALAAMEGEWAGSGWIIGPDQQRSDFDVFERAMIGSGGHAVIFRGEGFTPAGAGRGGEQVHDATGMITRTTDGYEMRAVTHMGYAQDVPFEITETGYRWVVDIGPQGEVVYTATIRDGVWEEHGEYCPAGAPQCFPTFYMRLEPVE